MLLVMIAIQDGHWMGRRYIVGVMSGFQPFQIVTFSFQVTRQSSPNTPESAKLQKVALVDDHRVAQMMMIRIVFLPTQSDDQNAASE